MFHGYLCRFIGKAEILIICSFPMFEEIYIAWFDDWISVSARLVRKCFLRAFFRFSSRVSIKSLAGCNDHRFTLSFLFIVRSNSSGEKPACGTVWPCSTTSSPLFIVVTSHVWRLAVFIRWNRSYFYGLMLPWSNWFWWSSLPIASLYWRWA